MLSLCGVVWWVEAPVCVCCCCFVGWSRPSPSQKRRTKRGDLFQTHQMPERYFLFFSPIMTIVTGQSWKKFQGLGKHIEGDSRSHLHYILMGEGGVADTDSSQQHIPLVRVQKAMKHVTLYHTTRTGMDRRTGYQRKEEFLPTIRYDPEKIPLLS